MKNALTTLLNLLLNYLVLLSSPVWIIPWIIHESIRHGDTGWMTGKGGLL